MAKTDGKAVPAKERAETDAGRLGDKVAVEDPAAAPLSTDAESAGTPTSPAASARSVDRLRRIAQGMPKPSLAPFASLPQAWKGRRHDGLVVLIGAVLVLIGTLAGAVSVASMNGGVQETSAGPPAHGTIADGVR